MDSIDNTANGLTSDSSLSTWVGPAPISTGLVNTTPRALGEDMMKPDTMSASTRMHSLTDIVYDGPLPLGPGASPDWYAFDILGNISFWDFWFLQLTKFAGFRYDSISIRITTTDVKNVVGAFIAGFMLFYNYFNTTADATLSTWLNGTTSPGYWMSLVNSTDCQLNCYGNSGDVVFEIPWTFKWNYIPSAWFTVSSGGWNSDGDGGSSVPHGAPFVFIKQLPQTSFVGTISNPVPVNVFCTFDNLRWYGPTSTNNIEQLFAEKRLQRQVLAATMKKTRAEILAHLKNLTQPQTQTLFKKVLGDSPPDVEHDSTPQSGLEAQAIMTVGSIAAESAISAVSEAIVGASSSSAITASEIGKPGNYDNPQAVQLSYVGDMASVDFPQTRPIFKGMMNMDMPQLPSPNELMRRPAYITTFTSNDTTQTFYNSPMNILKLYKTDLSPRFNMIGYFGMIHRYWRGTLVLKIVVAGHALVQVKLTAKVYFDQNYVTSICDFSNIMTHETTFCGVKTISIPMPFLHPADYLPVCDVTNSDWNNDINPYYRTTAVDVNLSVVSTALDVDPVIPAYVFLEAGPDFKYYQPYPCGMYSTDVIILGNKKDKRKATHPLSNQQNKKNKVSVKTTDCPPNKHHDSLPQIGLPTIQQEVVTSKAGLMPDPGVLPAFEDLIGPMKIWSRCLPFFGLSSGEPIFDARAGLSYPSWIPTTSANYAVNANNSWYFTIDFMAYISCLFLYWRGSIGIKVLLDTREQDDTSSFDYITLTGANDASLRTNAYSPVTWDTLDLPAQCNPGTGTVFTATALQPVLEATIPYRGQNTWGYVTNGGQYQPLLNFGVFEPSGAFVYDYGDALCQTSIQLVNHDGNTADALFRKADEDIAFCCFLNLPPPGLWVNRGFNPA